MKYLLSTLLVSITLWGFAQTPATSSTSLEAGDAKMLVNDYKTAVAEYSKAISKEPKRADLYLKRADARKKLKEYALAAADFDKAVVLLPSYNSFYLRGANFQEMGKFSEAINDFTKSITLKPSFDTAYYARGCCRFSLKDYKNALTDYNKTIELNNQNSNAFYFRGLTKAYLPASDKYQSAIEDIETCLSLKTSKTWVEYQYIAKSILETQTKEIVLLEKAETLSLTSIEIYKNHINSETYAIVLMKLGKLEQALRAATFAYDEAKKVKADIGKYAELKAKIKVEMENRKLATARSVEKENTQDVQLPKQALKLPKIWAVVVGVSVYKDTRLKLKYADKDAIDFYNFLRTPEGGGLEADQITLLTNEKATRSNIIRALNEKFNRAFEEDVVMIYIASHGQIDPVGNEVFFLNYDAEVDNLAGSAVAQSDIEKILKISRAKKKIWIADACHSGTVEDAFASSRSNIPSAINKLLGRISTSNNGTALLTASSSSEFSYEDARWGGGHGVFTYHLLEGMKGKADTNADGYVSIRELFDYVYKGVAEDTKGEQHPQITGNFDNKLPVSVAVK
jgi:tetratricopeptide (TPR) repeat protein